MTKREFNNNVAEEIAQDLAKYSYIEYNPDTDTQIRHLDKDLIIALHKDLKLDLLESKEITNKQYNTYTVPKKILRLKYLMQLRDNKIH